MSTHGNNMSYVNNPYGILMVGKLLLQNKQDVF